MNPFSLLIAVLLNFATPRTEVLLPIDAVNRRAVNSLELTEIGYYGMPRKARPSVAAHLHTGIDIKRPNNNYHNEPIFAIAEGIVISMRDDGPYAQLILEHEIGGRRVWSLYEHIAGISVGVGDFVTSSVPIARFMNEMELNKNGWQFDHFHFEVLKTKPVALKPGLKNPQRQYNSYTLVCKDEADLEKYFFHPMEFLEEYL